MAVLDVGFYVLDPRSEQVLKSAGLTSLDAGDQEKHVRALVDYYNAHGGLGGHKIRPIFATLSLADPESYSTQEQRACASFTEDHRVVAVLGNINTYGLLPQCLAQQRTPFIADSFIAFDDVEYQQANTLVTPVALGGVPAAQVYVEGLARQHFFDAHGMRLGLVRFDDARYARVSEKTLKPALQRIGVHLTDEYAIASAHSTGTAGQTIQAIQSAELKFGSEGITHVIFLDSAGVIAQDFIGDAANQHTKFTYGLDTYSQPATVAESVPASQLSGAVGVGWQPYSDLDIAHLPTPSPLAKRCLSIMAAEGQTAQSTAMYNDIFNWCDLFAATDRALLAVGPQTDVVHLMAALQSVGRLATIMNLRTRMDADRQGVAAVRDLVFATSCSCFAYVGPEHPV